MSEAGSAAATRRAEVEAVTVADGQADLRAEAMRQLPATVSTAATAPIAPPIATTPAASSSGPALLQQRAIESEEHAASVMRMRAALRLGLCIWPIWLLVDWMVVRLIEPGVFWHYALLRVVGVMPALVALWRLYRAPLPTPRQLAALDLAAYGTVAVFMTLLCLEFRGLLSPYGVGVSMILVCRSVTQAQPWRLGLLTIGVPAAAYPVVMLVAALFSTRIAAQLRDPAQLAVFVFYVAVTATVFVLLLIGGHLVWAVRRQLFEKRNLGRYRLKHQLDKGGMGEVWVAHHQDLRRDVALKILRLDVKDREVAVARFEREARAQSELSHPNTVRVLDYGVTSDGLWFYAMELLHGENLARLVRREGPLPAARVVHLVAQAARALAEAHGRGIVHRDIKPENLFVTALGGEADFVKVLDYGIAKVMRQDGDDESVTLTQEGWMGGTPAYMSPEAASMKPTDSRSDVYGLGGVLYFALTGHYPFEGNANAMLLGHMHLEPARPSERLGKLVPVQLEEVVMRCLQKDPDARYAHAGELAAALAACRV
jgi:serine/threonine-protein kinase